MFHFNSSGRNWTDTCKYKLQSCDTRMYTRRHYTYLKLTQIFNIFLTSLVILMISSILVVPCHSSNETPNSPESPDNNKSPLKQSVPYNKGYIFFRVSDPENLRYTFKATTSRIGVPFKQSFEDISLVMAEPRDACSFIINRLEIKDNMALVERGGCSFLEKCIEIERQGGAGLIIFDYNKHNDEHHLEMIEDGTARNCSIPAVSMLGKDGHMIVQSLLLLRKSRATITIPVQGMDRGETVPPWMVL